MHISQVEYMFRVTAIHYEMRFSNCANWLVLVMDYFSVQTYSPRVVQLETGGRLGIINLPSQIARQSAVSVHHCWTIRLAIDRKTAAKWANRRCVLC